MAQLRIPFTGCLYPGLKVDPLRGPVVLEFNARFGDPETEVLMMLLESDLLDILEACDDGEQSLSDLEIKWRDGYAVCVIMASGGYPDKYTKGYPITGLEEASADPDVMVFHAGTKVEGEEVVTAGGRVLAVTAFASSLAKAQKKAYDAVAKIKFQDSYHRRDIGNKAFTK